MMKNKSAPRKAQDKESGSERERKIPSLPSRRGQDRKYKIFSLAPRKAQEEMIGFALIIILVAVILLAFLGFSLNKQQETIQSYEVENFIQAFLQYTTDCEGSQEYFSVQDLIFECDLENICSNNGKETCDVLDTTLKKILEQAWPVGENRPYKGYELTILTIDDNGVVEEIIPKIEEGNLTNSYKQAKQTFSKRRKEFNIMFKAYSQDV